MKKVCLLSGMIVLGVVSIDAAQKLAEEQRQKIEQVQQNKLIAQEQLNRPAVYKMIDPLIKDNSFETAEGEAEVRTSVDWPAVFKIIDSMRGVINVNEFRTLFRRESLINSLGYENAMFPRKYTLLGIAVVAGNDSVAKTLLEKYKANPNISEVSSTIDEEGKFIKEEMFPLMWACEFDNIAMVKLLLQHGANPSLKNKQGQNSFDYARGKSAILDLLYEATSPARAA